MQFITLALSTIACFSLCAQPSYAETAAEGEASSSTLTLTQNTAPLAPCPDKPNCVSSQAAGEDHYVEPLKAGSSAEEASNNLLAVLADDRSYVVTSQFPNRITATFTSNVLGFVDDIEFQIYEDGMADVRSASRVGYWDLGANGRRVKKIRKELDKILNPKK